MFAQRWRFGMGWLGPIFVRAALLSLAITALLVWTVVHGGAGFSYALDAPYLQLALAQHIAHGTYGINAGETSSPVSSIIWPFLLAPFSLSSVRAWIPLALNLLAGMGVCAVAACFVHRYFHDKWQQSPELARWTLALLIVIAANLPALALVGVEHTLQVLLAAACAFGIAESYYSRGIPAWCLLSAALAPAVRYEDLAFTLAVGLACWFQGRRLAAVVTVALSLLPLALFGIFLHGHNLPFVPLPVLTEGRMLSVSSAGSGKLPFLELLRATAAVNARAYVTEAQRWPMTLLLIALCVQCWRVWKQPARRSALLSTVAGLVLIVAFGPYGYFYRYDVAYRFFAFLMVFAVAAEFDWFGTWQAAGLSAFAAMVYGLATVQTPAACWSIAHEQKQLQRFTHDFYRRNLLTNEPGWVAFDSGERFYTFNMASLTGKNGSAPAAWLDNAVQRHNIALAMISSQWRAGIPPMWKHVGALHRYGDGFNQVEFYATSKGNVEAIDRSLDAYAAVLPEGTWLTYEDGRRSDIEPH